MKKLSLKKIDRLKKRELKSRPWLKYYKDFVSPDLEYYDGSMVDYLHEAVLKYPDYIAYDYYGSTCTYRDLYLKIEQTAKSLRAQGVKEGDRVTICMPNTPEGIMMFYAINMIGAVSSMIHPLSAEKEIEQYINEADSRFLLTIDLVYDKIHNILDNTKINKVVVASISNDLGLIKTFLVKFSLRGKVPKIELTDDIMTWKEFQNYGYDYTEKYNMHKKSNDEAVILYSGGTTGNPKGILLSNLNFNALGFQCHMMCDPSKEGDSILSILPIFHGFGLGVCIHTPLCCGMKCILVPDFSPKKFVDLILKYKPNFLASVPTLYEMLTKSLKIGKKDLSFIKCVISGGDFMSGELKRRIDNFLLEHNSKAVVRVGYGLTECTGACCLTPTFSYKDDSIGVPFPNTYFKIVKNGTHDVIENGEDGEICISGPTVMMGYLNNIEETIQTLRTHKDKRVWLHTGDIGSMDKDGVIFFKQRIKRVIVSNGYNLYPSYIESIINTHESVLTSVVIGMSHPYKVQVAKAFIVLRD